MKTNNFTPLDPEEKDLIESLDGLDLKSIQPVSVKTKKLVQASAKDFIRRESKMNIRIDSFELGKIKERASTQGLRYSTFVKMVLHKYLTGQLVEK